MSRAAAFISLGPAWFFWYCFGFRRSPATTPYFPEQPASPFFWRFRQPAWPGDILLIPFTRPAGTKWAQPGRNTRPGCALCEESLGNQRCFWRARRDLNPQPSDPKSDALSS
jgi:hypothetical protein